jgi:hypothetical protein
MRNRNWSLMAIAFTTALSSITSFAQGADRLELVDHPVDERAPYWIIKTGEVDRLLTSPLAPESADGYYLVPRKAAIQVELLERNRTIRLKFPVLSKLEEATRSEDYQLPTAVRERSADLLLNRAALQLSAEALNWLKQLPGQATVIYKSPSGASGAELITRKASEVSALELDRAIRGVLQTGQEAQLTVRTQAAAALSVSDVDRLVSGLSFKLGGISVGLDENVVSFKFPDIPAPYARGEKIRFYQAYDWVDREIFLKFLADPAVEAAAPRAALIDSWRRDFVERGFQAYFNTKSPGVEGCSGSSEYWVEARRRVRESVFERGFFSPRIGEIEIRLVRAGAL